jgi:hypothetical protein
VDLQPGFVIHDDIPTVSILYLCQSDFPCSVQIRYVRQFRRVMSQRIVRTVIHGTVTRQSQVNKESELQKHLVLLPDGYYSSAKRIPHRGEKAHEGTQE